MRIADRLLIWALVFIGLDLGQIGKGVSVTVGFVFSVWCFVSLQDHMIDAIKRSKKGKCDE